MFVAPTQINAWLVKWSFKHASDVTTIPIGCSDVNKHWTHDVLIY